MSDDIRNRWKPDRLKEEDLVNKYSFPFPLTGWKKEGHINNPEVSHVMALTLKQKRQREEWYAHS